MAWRILEKLQERRRIGEVLIELGFLNDLQLRAALKKSALTKMRLGEVLVKENMVNEIQLTQALAIQFKLEYLDLEDIIPTPEALQCLPELIARSQNMLPLSLDNQILTLAVSDPLNVLDIQTVTRVTTFELALKISPESQLRMALERAYSKDVNGIEKITRELNEARSKTAKSKEKETEKGSRTSVITEIANRDTASIENLVNKIISRAVQERTSDIHIEPDEDIVRVRLRIDGILRESSLIPYDLFPAVVSRLKVMSGLDIAERRNSQDGRFRFNLDTKSIDLRISTLPTIRGEKVVMRILDKSGLSVKVSELGLSSSNLMKTESILNSPFGIIFVTGPTGSGKSTTVYSMLNYLNSVEKNIITVEDPVEYQFGMINQVNVQPKVGYTFASILKSILRQDPDIIMVGEIRDRETAEIAIRAALTGHLVITTLHTNNSPSTVGRLIDMGIDPTLISSALLGVVSQRLVRRLCLECREKRVITELDYLQLNTQQLQTNTEVYYPKGCSKCNGTGYRGRLPIFELLIPDSDIKKSILSRESPEQLQLRLLSIDFRSMRYDGVEKILLGLTTPAEVLKATLAGD